MLRVFALCLLMTVACSAGSSTDQAGEQITGTIVAIKANAADFDSITVNEDGTETEIFIKKNYDYGFDLVHLYEHQQQQEPVRVSIERRNGRPYATAIDDV
jgi:hypothetical protein